MSSSGDRDAVAGGSLGQKADCLAVPFGFLPPSYARRLSTAAVIHLFHEELAYEILAYANNLPRGTNLFISTDTPLKKERIERVFLAYKFGSCEVVITPNRGRDIAPKLVGWRDVYERYEIVLHLHSKSSSHSRTLAHWRPYLYETLAGSREQVLDVLGIFERAPNVGMIFAQHYEPIRPYLTWGANYAAASALSERMGHVLPSDHPLDFPSGSMFWARSAALKPLLDLRLSFDDFPDEIGQVDSTPAHAIERLYAIACELARFDWLKIARPELLADAGAALNVPDAGVLDRFVATELVRLTSSAAIAPIDRESLSEPPPALAAIAARHRDWALAAEKFGLWTKAPLHPWGPWASRY